MVLLDKLLRISDVVSPRGVIPVSRSTWYAGIKSGRYPKPIKLGARAVAWRASDIAELVNKGVSE